MKAFDVLLSLVRSSMFDEPLSSEIKETITDERLKKLYKLSSKHDIAHLVAHALEQNGLLGDSEIGRAFIGERDKAVLRYRLLRRELDDLSRVLDENGIPYIPLKGSVIRKYYPEPWMRTSCDVDVLVKHEDLDIARAALESNLGYAFKGVYTDHDISLFAPSGMHIELHYDLLDDDRKGEEIISRVWQYSNLDDGAASRYSMCPEFFYFYHVVHMANHFRHGGCGARTLLDLYMLNHHYEAIDRAHLDEMLSCAGFSEFEAAVRELSEVWFGKAEMNDLLCDVEEFILTGGVYGTRANRISVSQVKSGGRFKYLLSRIFISNSALKKKYPVLEERPYLIPLYHVRRWLKPIFNRKTKENSMNEISHTSDAEKNENKTAALLSRLNI